MDYFFQNSSRTFCEALGSASIERSAQRTRKERRKQLPQDVLGISH